MGTPLGAPQDEPKSVSLTVRLTSAKFAALKMILAITSETTQELLTRLIDQAFEEHRPEIEAVLVKQEAQ